MVLVQIWPLFQLFFFRQYRPGKCLLPYSIIKKPLSSLQTQEVKKDQKLQFLKLFFLANIGQENVFYDVLERENGFRSYKNNKSKKSKNWHFFIAVNPWFWCKKAIFPTFVFRQYRPGKCLLWYSRTKKRFSGL